MYVRGSQNENFHVIVFILCVIVFLLILLYFFSIFRSFFLLYFFACMTISMSALGATIRAKQRDTLRNGKCIWEIFVSLCIYVRRLFSVLYSARSRVYVFHHEPVVKPSPTMEHTSWRASFQTFSHWFRKIRNKTTYHFKLDICFPLLRHAFLFPACLSRAIREQHWKKNGSSSRYIYCDCCSIIYVPFRFRNFSVLCIFAGRLFVVCSFCAGLPISICASNFIRGHDIPNKWKLKYKKPIKHTEKKWKTNQQQQ